MLLVFCCTKLCYETSKVWICNGESPALTEIYIAIVVDSHKNCCSLFVFCSNNAFSKHNVYSCKFCLFLLRSCHICEKNVFLSWPAEWPMWVAPMINLTNHISQSQTPRLFCYWLLFDVLYWIHGSTFKEKRHNSLTIPFRFAYNYHCGMAFYELNKI